MEQSLASNSSNKPPGKQRDGTFGVESLAETLEAAFGPDDATPAQQVGGHRIGTQREMTLSRSESHDSSTSSAKLPGSYKTYPIRKPRRKLSSHASSTPLTPLNVDAPSPGPTSAVPSTPSAVSLQSLKLSNEDSATDEAASQAIMSSGDEEGAETTTQQGSVGGSFPQLVMPSIQMPSRRPFTTKGKAMGKFKIMVAGETGTLRASDDRDHLHSNILLTTYHRHREVISCPLYSSVMRRHRSRRSLIPVQLEHPTCPAQVKVSQEE